jgi:5-(carboxyamino)imidazole ribonucleotide mutase
MFALFSERGPFKLPGRPRAEVGKRRRPGEKPDVMTNNDNGGGGGDAPLVAVIMGSTSDWETMRHADQILREMDVPHECRVVSAHRTPHLLAEYASGAEERGIEVIIAGAGGAAHLPGMAAAFTPVPVLGVPVESHALKGMDSLLSIAQMPGGVPVGTLAIGKAGATNAGLLAVAILANSRPHLRERLKRFRELQTGRVLAQSLPEAAAPGGASAT